MRILLLLMALFFLPPDLEKRERIYSDNECEAIVMGPMGLTLLADGGSKLYPIRFNFAAPAENTTKGNLPNRRVYSKLFGEFETPIFQFNSNCRPYEGIIGCNVIAGSGAVHLDFDELRVCKIASTDIENLVSNDNYSEVEAKFRENKIDIAFSINWNRYMFRFDANEVGTFSIPNSKKLSFLNEHSIKVFSVNPADENKTYQSLVFPFTSVWIADIGYSSPVLITHEKTIPTVGLGFIKGFNWIIDYRNKKLYLKKNRTSIDLHRDIPFEVEVHNNDLIIKKVFKEISKYKVGDIVTSVNNTEVNDSNICNLFHELQGCKDWKNMSISVNRQ